MASRTRFDWQTHIASMASTSVYHRSNSSSDVHDFDLLAQHADLPKRELPQRFCGLYFCRKCIHWLLFLELNVATIHNMERVQMDPCVSGIGHGWALGRLVTGAA